MRAIHMNTTCNVSASVSKHEYELMATLLYRHARSVRYSRLPLATHGVNISDLHITHSTITYWALYSLKMRTTSGVLEQSSRATFVADKSEPDPVCGAGLEIAIIPCLPLVDHPTDQRGTHVLAAKQNDSVAISPFATSLAGLAEQR